MSPKSILVVVAIVLFAGCIATESINIELDKEFRLAKNQIATLKDENIQVKVIDIIYSPCPEGVQCIWSGLGANLMVSSGEGNETPKVFMLEMGHEKSIFGLKIQNIEVKQDYVMLMVKKEPEDVAGNTNIDDIFGEDTDILPPVIPD